MSTSITITTIRCIESSAPSDELYIKYSIDGGTQSRYPASGYIEMRDGGVWNNVGLTLTFTESAEVSLYDQDNPLSPDDPLGSYTYYPSDPQPEVVTVSNTLHGGDSYQISTVPA